MTKTDAARRLGIAHPLVQGPFGGGLSTARLAAIVADHGGLGSYGAHVLDPDGILAIAREIRALTSGAFALNLWVSNEDPGGLDFDDAELARVGRLFAPYFEELGVAMPAPPAPREVGHRFEDQVQAVLEARPPVFSFVFGVPSADVLRACRARDIVTVGTATTVAEARALDDAGVDVIVATGAEAGGHRPSFLARAEDSLMGTFALTPLVADRVKAPVVAAGGIIDGRGVRAALALGASGAQLGTAFLACEESAATPEHRAALFGEGAYHTTLTRSLSGRLARGIANRWTREMAGRDGELGAYPLQGWFAGQLKRAIRGLGDEPAGVAARTELSGLWGGQVAPNLRHRSAAALMTSLVREAREP
ncbi:MAG: nitronate monooxygenase [Myxococcota bacterium]|nr:nitronate monooxygenase [Myxococcota bacterium]